MGTNRRVLVIRPGALGDTVLSEPVVAALRAAWPRARIDLAGRSESLPLLVGPGLADGFRSMDSAEFTSLYTAGPVELPPYETVVAYLPDPGGALHRKLQAHVRQAVVFDPRPPPNGAVHIVDHLLSALEPMGVPVVRREPRLSCRAEWVADAEAIVGKGAGYAMIHPGSGGRHKLWQAAKWAELVERLRPVRAVLTFGAADAAVARDLTDVAGRGDVLVVRSPPITTLAGLLAGATSYFGCDSGVTHLAAALGVPTTAVFGPTDPRVWAPRGSQVRVFGGAGATRSVAPAELL